MSIFDKNIFDQNIFDTGIVATNIFDAAIFDSAIFDTGASAGPVTCHLSATEAQDSASCLVLSQISATLSATDQQDILDALVEEERVRTGWGEYKHPIALYLPLHASLFAAEDQDSAFMSAEFDTNDDDMVLALMSAAWDSEQVY